METYAGFLEHTDHCVGQLVDLLEQAEILDDTLIYYIFGDNGASAEGTLNGTFNEMINFNGVPELETPEFLMERIDEWGGRDSYPHYAVGWAHAMDTPYQWTKQVASHWGGTRNGTIVHWPAGITPKARCAPSSTTSSTWRRPSSKRRASRSRRLSRASCSRRWKASACSTASTTGARRTATPSSTSRCSATAASTTTAGRRSPATPSRGS